MDLSFYKNRRVLITGHTGFKGSWMCEVLKLSGADITGYSLKPPTEPSLFKLADIETGIRSIEGDIRDKKHLEEVFEEALPEVVIHMAAQPIVREGYKDPVLTYETNVLGTVNLLESVRNCPAVKSVVNVTTDKVYRNEDRSFKDHIFFEDDVLDGFDPYSNSKSCSELVTASYKRSFFNDTGPAVSTLRSGNTIGGGDFAKDRILPDCARSILAGEDVILRNPASCRPYQHVLEAVVCYLLIAAAQAYDKTLSGAYNIGPFDGAVTNEKLVSGFRDIWNKNHAADGESLKYIIKQDGGPKEAETLRLDVEKIHKTFGWRSLWDVDEALKEMAEFTDIYRKFPGGGKEIKDHIDSRIRKYLEEIKGLPE